jgi:hypothetical protein
MVGSIRALTKDYAALSNPVAGYFEFIQLKTLKTNSIGQVNRSPSIKTPQTR